MKKHKVTLSKMRTEIGLVPVLSGATMVNRPTLVYYAERQEKSPSGVLLNASIGFLVRSKDAKKLQYEGWNIKSILVPQHHFPIALNYKEGTKLEVRNYW